MVTKSHQTGLDLNERVKCAFGSHVRSRVADGARVPPGGAPTTGGCEGPERASKEEARLHHQNDNCARIAENNKIIKQTHCMQTSADFLQ